MNPDTKNVYNEARAVDVIGPVDRGDRMMAKNGDSSVGRGSSRMSSHRYISVRRDRNIKIIHTSRAPNFSSQV